MVSSSQSLSINPRKTPFKKKAGVAEKTDRFGYLFIAPFLVVFLIFSLYPMLYSIVISFTGITGLASTSDPTWNSFANFTHLNSDPRFWSDFLNTLIIFSFNFIPQIVSALFFAALFTSRRLRMRGKGVLQFIYFLPNIITASSVAVMFYALFQRTGINDNGEVYGGPIYMFFLQVGWISDQENFFLSTWSSRIIIAFIQFWMWFGNSMIIYISGIKGISDDIFESAEIEGASSGRVFFSITLPLLKPIMLYSLITSLIGGLQMFDIPYLLNSGGPNMENGLPATETITMYIYNLAFGSGDYQYSMAAAGSVILFLVSLLCSAALYFFFFREKKADQPHRGRL